MLRRVGVAVVLLGLGAGCENVAPLVSANPQDPEVRPERLTFGVVAVGDELADTIVVTNLNAREVVLSSLRVEGEDRLSFQVDPEEVVIEAQRTKQVPVRFAPLRVGRIQADLEIYHSEGTQPLVVTLVGTGTVAGPIPCVDEDADGYVFGCPEATDCDDLRRDVHPGAAEVCDGADNDCNGIRDDGLTALRYLDADGDTWGAGAEVEISACPEPEGYVARGGDCRDDLPEVNPGAAEACDGVDNDCNGVRDDGLTLTPFYRDADRDSFGTPTTSTTACAAPAGYVAQAGDCDDGRPDINPNQVELCDGLDNDCLNGVDDGLPQVTAFRDADRDGFGLAGSSTVACVAPPGYSVRAGDCNDARADINPLQAELCDGADNNCNRLIDEGLSAQTYYRDRDLDQFGDVTTATISCQAMAGWVAQAGDCDDTSAAARPGGTEVCVGGVDEDCDTLIDQQDPDCQCTTQDDCLPSTNGAVCPRTGAPVLQCQPLCRNPSDCAAGEACRPLPGSAGMGFCLSGAGPVAENGVCGSTADCSTGICFNGLCKRVCQSQADCAAGDVCGVALYSTAEVGGVAQNRQTMLCQPLAGRRQIGAGNCLIDSFNADSGLCATTHCDFPPWQALVAPAPLCAPLCAGAGDCGPNQVCGIVYNSTLEVPPIPSTQEGAGRFHDAILGCYTPFDNLGNSVPPGFGGLGQPCTQSSARTVCRSHLCAQFLSPNQCTDFCDDDADCVSPQTPGWRCRVAELNFASLFLQNFGVADQTKFSLVGVCAP